MQLMSTLINMTAMASLALTQCLAVKNEQSEAHLVKDGDFYTFEKLWPVEKAYNAFVVDARF